MPTIYRQEGPEYKANGELGKWLSARGVPSFYWGINHKNLPSPVSFSVEREWTKDGKSLTVSSAQQRDTMDGIFKGNYLQDSSMLMGVGSYPTDELGLVFGVAVMLRARELNLRPKMVNISWRPEDYKFMDDHHDVVVLHNIHNECTPSRVDMCRQWISLFEDVFIILVAGGVDNPVNFFYHKLHYRIDASSLFKGDGLYFQGDGVGG